MVSGFQLLFSQKAPPWTFDRVLNTRSHRPDTTRKYDNLSIFKLAGVILS